ncbi:hypothetical protein CBG53_10230 [Porphyromonas gingivalis]|uniref:DNA cytosine methyltransferase n=1 Tax=Porphyromonas gingivalis TaxID=837 RepID=UPI000B4D3DCB|nr:DNA cytosine methyltransferase [Porphyromonas gingivalis]ATR94887.1 hypothetical protein CS546_07550 [Porphyromonas gingivalis]ATR96082.1 hypothetical protein CS548_02665 [Porphyromonas gingivalis]MDP0531460.1 DNA cytosine methyltransferase [Porphyromonas gingivalis]MDP0625099.1 DNA cytosine methyltransferase [Porphyromonas gingivalis]OWP28211.1 hypothetical protein CBG53_10230 [Porphyromonas gingivalis]
MTDIISLFSGCGGLDLGFEQTGNYTSVWANDFKREACDTFRHHFGNIIVEGNIELINPYTDPNIPNCDLILGGFPCQGFSIIWKQPGLKGKKRKLLLLSSKIWAVRKFKIKSSFLSHYCSIKSHYKGKNSLTTYKW